MATIMGGVQLSHPSSVDHVLLSKGRNQSRRHQSDTSIRTQSSRNDRNEMTAQARCEIANSDADTKPPRRTLAFSRRSTRH